MTTANMMNRVELNNNELDAVNGGFGWEDVVNFGKKVGNKVETVVKKEVNKVVDTVVDGMKTTIETIKNVDTPVEPYKLPRNPIEM